MNKKKIIVDMGFNTLFWSVAWLGVYLWQELPINTIITLSISGAILNVILGAPYGFSLDKVRSLFRVG